MLHFTPKMSYLGLLIDMNKIYKYKSKSKIKSNMRMNILTM